MHGGRFDVEKCFKDSTMRAHSLRSWMTTKFNKPGKNTYEMLSTHREDSFRCKRIDCLRNATGIALCSHEFAHDSSVRAAPATTAAALARQLIG